jgi:hypothetical protein
MPINYLKDTKWTPTLFEERHIPDVAGLTIALRLLELAALARSGILPIDLHPGVDPSAQADESRVLAGTGLSLNADTLSSYRMIFSQQFLPLIFGYESDELFARYAAVSPDSLLGPELVALAVSMLKGGLTDKAASFERDFLKLARPLVLAAGSTEEKASLQRLLARDDGALANDIIGRWPSSIAFFPPNPYDYSKIDTDVELLAEISRRFSLPQDGWNLLVRYAIEVERRRRWIELIRGTGKPYLLGQVLSVREGLEVTRAGKDAPNIPSSVLRALRNHFFPRGLGEEDPESVFASLSGDSLRRAAIADIWGSWIEE